MRLPSSIRFYSFYTVVHWKYEDYDLGSGDYYRDRVLNSDNDKFPEIQNGTTPNGTRKEEWDNNGTTPAI